MAGCVSDGRLLGWIEPCLEMAVEGDDGQGGKRRPNRARCEQKSAPISPLFSNVYMRRLIPVLYSSLFRRNLSDSAVASLKSTTAERNVS